MSMLKKIISILLCIAMLIPVLASCDTDDSYNHETSESTTDGIQPHTHTPATAVTEKFVDSSCTATGSYDEVVYCSECQEEISRTQKTVDKKPHDHSQKVTTAEYLKTEATCTDSAVYYYSCVCGVAGTETFSHGEALNIPVKEIVIDSSLIYVDAGETASVGVTLLPENATFLNMTYTSSNESVATVSNGVITARSDGSAVITVSVDGIVSKSFTVVVENSAGIKYEVSGDGYNVLSVPNPQETVVIPDTYKGKAVKTISINTFGAECSVIRYLYISKSVTIPDAALTNCTQLKKLVLYGGSFIWSPSSDPYDFYRFFRCVQISFAFAPGDLRPGCGSWSHSWEYCDGTCAWYVTNPQWKGWIYNTGTGEDWYWPHDRDYGVFFRRDAIIDWQTYNGYRVPKNIRMQVYKVPKSLEMFYDGYIILEPEASTVCISAVDDLKIKFNGELIDVSLVSVVSSEDREKLHTIGTHTVTIYYGGFTETVRVTVGHVTYNVEENRVEATCEEDGSYDSVMYCSVCKEELSRKTVILPAEHQGKNGTCTLCGSKCYSSGLNFISNGDSTCYVNGIGSCTDTYVYIPKTSPSGDTVTSIGDFAFKGCSNLIGVTIPDSVMSIGDSAFYNCTSLTSITLPFTGATPDATSYKAHFGYIFGYKTSTSTSSEYHYYYYDSSIHSYRLYFYYIPTSLTTVVITGGTKIGTMAFYNCTTLTSVTIPDGVTSICQSAFYGCNGLTSITIPDSVTNIDRWAFESCTGLTEITIPESVKSIQSQAFQGCDGLTSITVASGNAVYHSAGNCLIETASNTLILGCKNSVIPIDGSVVSIGIGAFAGCTSLTSITIPDSVINIDDIAFYECTSLTSVTIGKGVTSIHYGAFANCTRLKSITFDDTTTWYKTSDETKWKNKKGGTQTSVTNAYTNASNFVIEIDGGFIFDTTYYWYKL